MPPRCQAGGLTLGGLLTCPSDPRRMHTGGGGNVTEVPLSLSLEEMQRGGLKQVTIARDLADGVSGDLLTVDELVTVQLTPGIREGTRSVLPFFPLFSPALWCLPYTTVDWLLHLIVAGLLAVTNMPNAAGAGLAPDLAASLHPPFHENMTETAEGNPSPLQLWAS